MAQVTKNSQELSFLFHFYFVILSLSFSLLHITSYMMTYNKQPVSHTIYIYIYIYIYYIFILFQGTNLILKFINVLVFSPFHIRLAT